MEHVEQQCTKAVSEQEAPNRLQTGLRTQDAARALEQIVREWGDERRPAILLLALCRLAAESESAGAEGFSYPDLVDAVRKMSVPDWGGEVDPDRLRKLVARNWSDLEKIWTERRAGVIERFADLGLPLIPDIDRKEGGGRGHPTRYWLRFGDASDVPVTVTLEQRATATDGNVRYYTDEVSSAWILRWLARRGFPLVGWRAKVFLWTVAVFMLGIMGALLLGWFGVMASPSAVKFGTSTLSLGLFSISAWLLLVRPLMDLVNNRVILAPWWMQGWNAEDRLIELRRMEEIRANTILLTRYTGKCSLCGGSVGVASGGREFPGRLVGRCGRAPNEHVFSFDHVLRIGKSLR